MSATTSSNSSGSALASPGVPDGARLAGVWQVRLLGSLEARNGEVVLTHFISHAIGALLARLALQPRRGHPREELVELLWPGVGLDVGRNRLRNAISTLRRLLEPPGQAAGSVLVADRHAVQLAPGAIRCDALEFERCVREQRGEDARQLYRGELLPGFYEDWVQDERIRLAALRERLGDELPPPVSVRASAPVATALPATAAAALPGYLTSYVGREAERASLGEWIATHRLVTLSGPGGCGKTRIAVEVARAAAGFDTVAFVALADCASAAQCAAQLRTTLHLPPSASDPLDQAITMLSVGTPLLVLDNFEQLVNAGGLDVVETLLQRVPALHLLVTSRRVLGVPGEREFALAPLPPPDPRGGLEAVARNPSVALFVDRARNARPDFQVTARNHEAVAALCLALEGLPLAIELAASRSRAFSPSDMHAALSQRFSLLTRAGGRAGRPVQRHDTLHGAIDWSWRLLDARQQRFLIALSVFRGGWSAASAQAVCEEPHAHDLLDLLAADSLLRGEVDHAGSMRFFMLDMIREFLRERQELAPARVLRQQHRAHYLAMVLAWRARGALVVDEAELPNVHEALRTAVDDGESELALTLALALRHHWEANGVSAEALALLKRALDHAAAGDTAWVNACIMTALLTLAAGDGAAAHALAERALARAGARPALRAAALCAMVRIAIDRHLHSDELMRQIDEAGTLAEASGAEDLVAQTISLRGVLTLHEGHDPAGADAYFAKAHARYLSVGMAREASLLLYERTLCLMRLGRRADALAQARAFERECMALGDRQRQLKAINLQGVLHAELRQWRDAVRSYRRCARIAWATHNHYWLGFALWNHGRNLARLREPERAARLMAFSEGFWRNHFGALDDSDRRYVRQVRALVAHQLGESRMEALWAEGARHTLPQAVALSLSLAD